MIDFLEDIYKYAMLIPQIKTIIKSCYEDEVEAVNLKWPELIPDIEAFCNYLLTLDGELANQLMDSFESACSCTTEEPISYILFADRLRDALTILYKATKYLGGIDVTESGYRLYSSRSGMLTIEKEGEHKPIHSTDDPMTEAGTLIGRRYLTTQRSCRLLGCGLGYGAYQAYIISNRQLDIYIYDVNQIMIKYAMDYGVLSLIPSDRLHIIVDEDLDRLTSCYLEDIDAGMKGATLYYCYDYIFNMLQGQTEKIMTLFNARMRTYYANRNIIEANFYRNIYNVTRTIYDIDVTAICRQWMVIAGGPSLDDQLDYIRSVRADRTIIAASTVLAKLEYNGIVPDYVAVLDPLNRTYGHMTNVSDMSPVLLLNAVGSWQYSEYYLGDKYLIPPLGQNVAEEYYTSRGIRLMEIGSSVSVMCVHIAILLGAKQIDLIGLDLSYPGGHTHASGTMDNRGISDSGRPVVRSVNGGTVATNGEFIIYLDEIKKVVEEHPEISFVNYSLAGAYIDGAKWYKEL